MENQKSYNLIITLLVVVVVMLLTSIILLSTGVIGFKSSCNQSNGQTSSDSSAYVSDFKVDVNKLAELYGTSDYNILKRGNFDINTPIVLLTDGRIMINFEDYISNISNAKDILVFAPPGPSYILYILTEDGDIYSYSSEEYENGNYVAVKDERFSNIKNIITYTVGKANAGGSTYFVAIDSNDEYYKINSFGV